MHRCGTERRGARGVGQILEGAASPPWRTATIAPALVVRGIAIDSRTALMAAMAMERGGRRAT